MRIYMWIMYYVYFCFITLLANLGLFCSLAPIIIKMMECYEKYCIVYYLRRH